VNAEQIYAQGEAHLSAGEWLLASQCFVQVLGLLPEHGCAHHLLGKAQAQLGALEVAEALQLKSCELDPKLGWNWFALAELQEQRGALLEAKEAFQQAATSLPHQRWIADRARRVDRQLTWQQVRQLASQTRFGLHHLAQIVWQLRPDLREQLGGDQEELLLWLLLEGPQEYAASIVLRDQLIAHFQPIADQPALLPSLAFGFNSSADPPISQLLYEIWFQQPHLQRKFDLTTLAGRVGLFWWYVIEAVPHYELYPLLSGKELDYIHEPVEIQGSAQIMRLAIAAWSYAAVELAREDVDQWFWTTALQQLRLGSLLCAKRIEKFGFLSDLSSDRLRSILEVDRPVQLASSVEPRPFGVNLIGYAQGQLGIGEDLRMAVKALDAVGVPCSVYNVEPDSSIHCDDHSLTHQVSDRLPYAVNLFCLTGVETARLAVSHYLPMMLPGSINIGYWPWEFARWPAHWSVAYRMVDEIWASTRFTAEAYQADAVVPVKLMPMLVDIEPSASLDRKHFNLPKDAFLFCFSFDCSSSIRRKNPWAVLEAFQIAFPLAESAAVGLVVKVMRGQMRQPAYRRLLQRARADQRIHLIEETLPRDALLDLYRVCDAYISLHRCEGFGRGMAEAMLLNKPVIATNYSGNTDFCTDLTSLLVPASLRPVLPGDYPEAQGLQWADPDVSKAAEAMRLCALSGWYPNPDAVEVVRETYSAYSVGLRYRQRLQALLNKNTILDKSSLSTA